jgi:CTP synthase
MVPFPALRDKVPTMMADMKDLELIPIADIDAAEPGTSKYFRVAGLDSPFREEISWAYMQNACRPGMPERELEPWRNEIMDSCGA